MTHRVFSRNASSSRAIPVKRMIADIRKDPAMPIHWGANQSGMQAREELTPFKKWMTRKLWLGAMWVATTIAGMMNRIGAHKQIVNRIIEPWQHIHVIVSSTEWANWDALRIHPDAMPDIQELARKMQAARMQSRPVSRDSRYPDIAANWHLPYVDEYELKRYAKNPLQLAKLSVARCARVSYLNHDGSIPNATADVALYNRLVGSEPIHASPTEHAAFPFEDGNARYKNFTGWCQYRGIVERDTALASMKFDEKYAFLIGII
ncbi:FAD-dependent thymidylate synthase [Oxalobacter sp. OttesenSCG-928-P03]|nr:FAD-dependent thymidylate synthase [Oxalobacter sp. OttesenSCG-928-P03]